jgi:predicted MPP superfamily phosphohydrolase
MKPRNTLSRRGVIGALLSSALLPPTARAEQRVTHNEYFEVTRTELFIPGLHPSHDGLVIAQLSDIHVGRGSPDGRIIAAVRMLNEEAPDVAVLTGDYVTTKRDPYERVPQLLKGINAPTYAVMGNHDHYTDAPYLRRGLEGIGYTVLQNEHSVLRIKGADFNILGVDDCTTHHDDVDKTFKGNPAGSRLVLAHTPTTAKKLPAWQGMLCLSGHTHGGQLHVPKLTQGIFAKAGMPYVRGLYNVRGNQLYVNRGLGFGKGTGLPRLNSDPELSLVTLRAIG